jgi:hypothetical protein
MLKITRFSGQKIVMKGQPTCTVTTQACTDEMCRIYGAPFVARIENKNLSVTFSPIYSDKWNNVGKMQFKVTNTNNGQVTFIFDYTEEECLILRAELICRDGDKIHEESLARRVFDGETVTPDFWKEQFTHKYFELLGGGAIPDSIIRQSADIDSMEFIDGENYLIISPEEAAKQCVDNWD